MKTPLPTLAIAIATLALGTLSLSAGESRKPTPSASAKAVHGVHQQRTIRQHHHHRSQLSAWKPWCHGSNPVQYYRYGDPVGPISSHFYGFPSMRDFRFYQNYPVAGPFGK